MQIEDLERLHEAATAAPWEVDTIKSEGEYGSGPDTTVGFNVSAILDPNGKVLADALNSDLIYVREDYGDEDGYVTAWDETSANNFALIVALRNALPDIIATYRERDSYKAALEPFAKALEEWGDDTGQPDRWDVWQHPIAMDITLGDFRRARTALERRGSE